MKKVCAFVGMLTALVCASGVESARGSLLTITASDNSEDGSYNPLPNHNWSVINGGFGYNLWTQVTDTTGGGTYMEGVGVNGRQTDGSYDFALYAGGGGFDISRPLTTPQTNGEFEINTRADLAASPGLGLVNLRAGNNTSAFGSGELMSFGLANGNQLTYTDGTGLHTLPSGEARGVAWHWQIDFDASLGTYSGQVSSLTPSDTYSTTFSGSLQLSSTSVGSFAVINTSSGNNQNMIFDNPVFSVPEPSAFMLVGASALALFTWSWRDRSRVREAKPARDGALRTDVKLLHTVNRSSDGFA